jgi:hypothetical protein
MQKYATAFLNHAPEHFDEVDSGVVRGEGDVLKGVVRLQQSTSN